MQKIMLLLEKDLLLRFTLPSHNAMQIISINFPTRLLASLKNYQSAKDVQLVLLRAPLALFRIAFNFAKMEMIALQSARIALI
jgi:hypothetical protein